MLFYQLNTGSDLLLVSSRELLYSFFILLQIHTNSPPQLDWIGYGFQIFQIWYVLFGVHLRASCRH